MERCHILAYVLISALSSLIQIKATVVNLPVTIPDSYEPLYLIFENYKYDFFDSIRYNGASNPATIQTPGRVIFFACRKANDNNGKFLEIPFPGEDLVALNIRCLEPVPFVVERYPDSERYMIGYLIYKSDGDSRSTSPFWEILPRTIYPVPLIKVAYERTGNHGMTTWHSIRYGELLQAEALYTPEQFLYRSDQEIYHFDVDAAYSEENLKNLLTAVFGLTPPFTLVKFQLAPDADFWLQNWKTASRTNINTTPMWNILESQWHELEKFVRRVSQVLGHLQITTGASDIYAVPQSRVTFTPLLLHNGVDLPVYKYLWKAITFKQYYNGSSLRYGIIFVMHNDPQNILEAEPICDGISFVHEDTILENVNEDEEDEVFVQVTGTVVNAVTNDDDANENENTPVSEKYAKIVKQNDYAERNGWKFLKNLKLQSHMYACPIISQDVKGARVQIQRKRRYSHFDLHNVLKVSKDEQGAELLQHVDVLENMKGS